MTQIRFYGNRLANFRYRRLPGALTVLEGTDGVGRSTQVALLREWLESEGYAAAATGLKRGALAGRGIKDAMQGHTLEDITMNLLYATDFADRLEGDHSGPASQFRRTDRSLHLLHHRACAGPGRGSILTARPCRLRPRT